VVLVRQDLRELQVRVVRQVALAPQGLLGLVVLRVLRERLELPV